MELPSGGFGAAWLHVAAADGDKGNRPKRSRFGRIWLVMALALAAAVVVFALLTDSGDDAPPAQAPSSTSTTSAPASSQ